jgi:glycosyltransferase involved in cell wall biosynthesis
MKIVYLTWGETPRSIGVFGSQVLAQFEATISARPTNEYHLICAVPVVHSGLIREKWKYFSEIRKCESSVGGALFHYLNLCVTQNFIYSAELGFKLFHGGAHSRLFKLLEQIQPDIVHCRSYHAAWAAHQVRESCRAAYKIVFDGRDLWPEIVALKNGWTNEHASYLYLKSIESELLKHCDASVSVSKPMANQYIKLGSKRDRLINVSADTKNLLIQKHEYQVSECVRFCYVGALEHGSWHDIKCLVELYRHLRTLFEHTKITIVTTSNHKNIKTAFSEFPSSEVTLISHRGTSQLRAILINQDIGILSYFKPRTELERIVASVVLAVKVGEYFSAGLPIICNGYCAGTADLIQNEDNLGIVYWPERVEEITAISIKEKIKSTVRTVCRQYSSENFDIDVNANKYHKLYSELMNGKK